MSYKLNFPHYFAEDIRREIGDLYASVAIADFAIAIVSIFEPIFLYTVLHFSVPEILMLNALTYVTYIILIPWGAKIASKFGYAHGILFSIPFQILFWVFLYAGQETPGLLIFGFILYGIEKALYFPAFDASVARFARDDQRGREFSVLYVIINLVSIIAPLIGGLLSEQYGIRIAFVAAAAIYASSFIPLFLKKEVFTPKEYQFKDTLALYREFPKKAFGYMGFGEEMLFMNAWPIFFFLVVKDYQKIGTLVTMATLIASAVALYVGRITDQYSKRMLEKIGALFHALTWVFRITVTSVTGVFAAETMSRTSKDVVHIPLSTLTYERAESIHIMPYVVFFEQSLAIGKLSAAVLGSLLFYFTGSFVVLFIVAGIYSLLYMFI